MSSGSMFMALACGSALVMSGGALYLGLSSPAPAHAGDPAAELGATPAPSSRQAEAIGELDTRLRRLELRVTALENRPGGAAAAERGPGALAEEVSALRREVEALEGADHLEREPVRERLRAEVRGVQAELFRERMERFRADREQEEDERFERFAEEARLTLHQKEQLQRLIAAEREAIGKTFEAMRAEDAPARPSALRQALREARGATDAQAKQLLGAEQLTRFEELREESRGGFVTGGRGSWRRGRRSE